jgi:hypothetical protein
LRIQEGKRSARNFSAEMIASVQSLLGAGETRRNGRIRSLLAIGTGKAGGKRGMIR